jgi:hypothetical protein
VSAATSSRRIPANAALIPVLLALGLLARGCDNPACVFGPGNCHGTGGGVGENAATLPLDGEWIATLAPTLLKAFPAPTAPVDVNTPIVLLFSESMSPINVGTTPPSGLGTAFELQPTTGGVVPLPVATLIGDGRMLVLLPPVALQANTTYNIVLRSTASLADRTGQGFVEPVRGLIGSFTTAATPSAAPKVLASWPQTAATNQSDTGEIVVAFERALNPTTVDSSSFDVTVDGNPPTFDPSPRPLTLGGIATDARVFRWRSVDAQGLPAPLGEGKHVEVALSRTGHTIEDAGGAALAPTTIAFDTAPFSAPLSVAITSDPTDAIGIDEISGPADLAVQAQLSGAQSGDSLVLTMFGTLLDVAQHPRLVALHREVVLTPPFGTFTLTAAEIDLLKNASPVQGRFEDGTVTFAFQLRRGSAVSPVRLLDVDPVKSGVQNPILDTVAPVLFGLSTSGNVVTSLRSDLRDVVLVGRASEPLRQAAVATTLGDNSTTPGVAPPVVGADASGLFVAAPVRAGVLAEADDPLDYTLVIYDRALNSITVRSDALDPSDGFRQLGASGPGNALPGGSVSVEVYDATSFAPVVGANVYVHENVAGVVTAVTTVAMTTDAAGRVLVPASAAGETIVTVEKPGYDLFTFDGVPTDRLGIPLSPTGLALASATGTLGPADSATTTQLNFYTRSVADSRHPEIGDTLFPVALCSFDPAQSRFECPFGPLPIRPSRIGAQSAVTVLVPSSPFLYSALTFLKTAELSLPILPVAAAATGDTRLPITALLDAGTLNPEERPIDVPPHMLSTAAWPGLPSDPIVTVEATAPGLPGTVTIGQGVAFNDALPPDTWAVRAAYPGAADGIQDVPGDQLGRLVTQGTIDADLLVRVEVVDVDGNRGGSRPRLSLTTLSLSPPAPPLLSANPATPNPGGESFDLTFADVLPDAASPPGKGLYRIVLTDGARSWTLFRPDPPDASGPDVVLHVPDLGGVFPLAAGSLDGRISAWSWPGLDLSRFLWSDIEREHDLFAHSKIQSFTPP